MAENQKNRGSEKPRKEPRRSPRAPSLAAALLPLLAGTPVALGQFAVSGGGSSGQAEMRNPLNAGMDENQVRVNEHLIVDLHVKDEDLGNVLQMLSLQSQINIVASRNVAATVTADLYGATFYEALDAILHVNGYGYVEKGNFIYVYTAEELTAIQEANRRLLQRVIELDYLNSTDAAEFVRPLLSDRGEIKTHGKTDVFNVGDMPVGKDDYAMRAVLVVYDFEENVDQIETMVRELDTRPAQVLVEATILETALTEDNAFGIDFSVLGSLDMADFTGVGGPLKVVDALITGAGSRLVGSSPTTVNVPNTPDSGGHNDRGGGAGTVNVGRTQGPGGLKVGVVSGDVAAFLRVLDEVTDVTVISRPNVLTLNRQPARVLVGTKVGFLSSTSTDTATTQTVEFLDTGTQLYFRPFIARDGMIRMELRPSVSNASIRDVTTSAGAAVTIPDENTSELTTNVMVRDGNTIVLGGLFTEKTTKSRRQVPFIGDIPVLGFPFRGHDDSVDRNEIIFMIKPTIVNDQMLADQGQRGLALVNAARAGARVGLLPWSREKRSGKLLVQADRRAREGDIDGALYSIERSLGLNPNQPEARAMRERLSSKKRPWPSRIKLDTVVYEDEFRSMGVSRGPRPAGGSTTPAAFTGGQERGGSETYTLVPSPSDGGVSGGSGNESEGNANGATAAVESRSTGSVGAAPASPEATTRADADTVRTTKSRERTERARTLGQIASSPPAAPETASRPDPSLAAGASGAAAGDETTDRTTAEATTPPLVVPWTPEPSFEFGITAASSEPWTRSEPRTDQDAQADRIFEDLLSGSLWRHFLDAGFTKPVGGGSSRWRGVPHPIE